jgi:cysteine synthase A
MDQFTYAERATDWRGNNNIAESIFAQMRTEEHPVPRWIVTGAGTGGTAATIGRYIRYRGYATELCVVDPEHSVFFDYYRTRDATLRCDQASAIEGIGRPRAVPSFIPEVVDRLLRVPDTASIAALRLLERLLSRKYGGSTGTAMYGALYLAHQMAASGEAGSIVALAGDGGDRYLDTYYDDGWLRAHGYDITAHLAGLDGFYRAARWDQPAPASWGVRQNYRVASAAPAPAAAIVSPRNESQIA